MRRKNFSFKTSFGERILLLSNSLKIISKAGIKKPIIKYLEVVFDFALAFMIAVVRALSMIELSGVFEAF